MPTGLSIALLSGVKGLTFALVGSGLFSITVWLGATATGTPPPADYTPRVVPPLVLSSEARADALRRAGARLTTPPDPPPPLAPDAVVSCVHLPGPPSGTSPKFDCTLPGGAVVKVKYGRNPEIHAEVAATRLLDRLGFAADRVTVVPRLRCYGCPRFPFVTAHALAIPGVGALLPKLNEGTYSEFEMVAVEWKFPAVAIETNDTKGWAWWEVRHSDAPRAELDALRLLAVFLAHWDNKSENQRLVCLSDPATLDASRPCDQPLLMIQDAGATFGPPKVNLVRWRDAPIWSNARSCTVTMRSLPFGGGTFPEWTISEAGRLDLLARLQSLTNADIRNLFSDAYFPHYYAATDDAHDLTAWTAAFRHRVDMIAAAGPCGEA